jgi:hypothetical protein
MRAVDQHHSPTPEEIMEYVDGEGLPAAREAIAGHLTGCQACQAIAAEQRSLSRQTQAWIVEAPPASMQPPAGARHHLAIPRASGWFSLRPPIAAVGVVGAVLVAVAFGVRETRQVRKGAPAASAQSAVTVPHEQGTAVGGAAGGVVGGVVGGVPGRRAGLVQRDAFTPIAGVVESVAVTRTPSVIRTATLRIVVKSFEGVRTSVEAIVSGAAGFIDQMTVTGEAASARQLRGTLRVPADRLADVLARLREAGEVIEDSQGSQDVTDQIVDLDARLASARATEKRLTELLQNRTGRLSDVLDVERELARVRLDIERLDAEKTNVGRRVSYATIDITISEARKSGLDGPLPLATRIRVAALDGLENAIDSLASVTLFALRAGPTLTLWAAAAALLWLIARRRGLRIPHSR